MGERSGERIAVVTGVSRHIEADLGDPDASAQVIEKAVEAFGAVDTLVVNHAMGSNQSLETVSAEELDRAWR